MRRCRRFLRLYQGVKEVLKAKERLGGIRGAVLELISTERKYETAIEIALGASAQHVVTDDEQSARKAIQYLKQNSFGRATFLPLSVIRTASFKAVTRKQQDSTRHFSGLPVNWSHLILHIGASSRTCLEPC